MKNLETKLNALRDFNNGMNITEVCRKYGIARPTMYEWIKKTPSLEVEKTISANESIPQRDLDFESVELVDVEALKRENQRLKKQVRYLLEVINSMQE